MGHVVEIVVAISWMAEGTGMGGGAMMATGELVVGGGAQWRWCGGGVVAAVTSH